MKTRVAFTGRNGRRPSVCYPLQETQKVAFETTEKTYSNYMRFPVMVYHILTSLPNHRNAKSPLCPSIVHP